ncbi:TonB-dependent receptor plug domain-containing protein [Qipengyuania sediminis]|uniref:TonB-dependent receptor plug domain-containing protein n=1 Tax=Qipengyuania sediminis TaxID=1532023 RepID=UPI00105A6B85|nr:TonB-dependent receptor [Qipengyuania sediminis]
MRTSITVSAWAMIAATPALSQTAPAEPAPVPAPALSESEVDEIVVTAERVRGQVQTASAPVVELDQAQIQAQGASSIADLVAQLAPQIGSGRGRGGRPVFLVNGQRITNFREIGRYPPEAVRKVEVLPEEVAVKFGFPPDQRVINFILQNNFASREAEVEYGAPTRGGTGTGEAELGLLRIDGLERLNANVSYTRTSPLTEAERDIVQTPGSIPTIAGEPDPAAFRTLVARREQIEGNLTSTLGLGEAGSAGQVTLNSQWVHSTSTGLSGLDLVTLPDGVIRAIDADPIERRTNTDTGAIGAGYSTRIAGYQFQTTLDAGLTDTETRIDRRRTAAGPVVEDFARSKVWTAGVRSTLIGSPFDLPGGEFGVTLNAAYDWDRIESFDTRTARGETTLTRGNLSAGANVALPIASRRAEFLGAIGDLTVNLGGGIEHLSDFGTLGNGAASLVWRPAEPLTLQASYILREAAPGLAQLGGPTITSFNVPVFDFARGETVLVTQVSGGNPFLRAETQRDLKLSASYDIDLLDRANILVEYYRNQSEDVTSSFPLLTPAIEAAFPARVTREAATGRLTAIDVRPVTFAKTRSERLRYGFTVFGRLGKPAPPGQAGAPGIFGALANRPAAPAAGAAPSASGTSPAPGGPPATAAMDPQRLMQMRTQFCTSPAGTIPDLSALPPQLRERMLGADGKPDPARIAVMRERFCSADAQRRFDPARFAAMREALCADPSRAPDPAVIPEEIRERLKGPDGTIAPERLKEFQTRICALPVTQRQPGQGGGGGQSRGGGGSPRGGGGGGGFGGPPDGQGRWSLAAYHTINLGSTVTIASGGPVLDLLDGDATGSGGGVSRHQLELEGGVFHQGVGLRLSGTYNSATRVDGSELLGSSDLRFGGLARVNLRAFVALDQQRWLVGEEPGFFKNARLQLAVDNIFDARQSVTDETGAVPLRFQPFLIDPIGRFVEIELRKLF